MKNSIAKVFFVVMAVFLPFFGTMHAAAGSRLSGFARAAARRAGGRVAGGRSPIYQRSGFNQGDFAQIGAEDMPKVKLPYADLREQMRNQRQAAADLRAQRDMMRDAVAQEQSRLQSQGFEQPAEVELTQETLRALIRAKRDELAQANKEIEEGGVFSWLKSLVAEAPATKATRLNEEINALLEQLAQMQPEVDASSRAKSETLADILAQEDPHFGAAMRSRVQFPEVPQNVLRPDHYLTQAEARVVEADHEADMQQLSVRMEQQLQTLLDNYKAGMRQAYQTSKRRKESYNQRYGRLLQEKAKFEQAFAELFTHYKSEVPISKETFIQTWQNMQGPEQADHLDMIAQAERPLNRVTDLRWDPKKEYKTTYVDIERAKETFARAKQTFDRVVFGPQDDAHIVPTSAASSSSAGHAAYVSRVPEGGLPGFVPKGTRAYIQGETFKDLERAGVPKEERKLIRAKRYQEIGENLVELARTEGASGIPAPVLEALKSTAAESSATASSVVTRIDEAGVYISSRGAVEQAFLDTIAEGEAIPFMFVEYNPPVWQVTETTNTTALVPVEQQAGEVIIHVPNKDGLFDTLRIDLAQAPAEYRDFFAQFIQQNQPMQMALYHQQKTPTLTLSSEVSGTDQVTQTTSMIDQFVRVLKDENVVGVTLRDVPTEQAVATSRQLISPKKRARDWASWQKRLKKALQKRKETKRDRHEQREKRIIEREARLLRQREAEKRQQKAAEKKEAKTEQTGVASSSVRTQTPSGVRAPRQDQRVRIPRDAQQQSAAARRPFQRDAMSGPRVSRPTTRQSGPKREQRQQASSTRRAQDRARQQRSAPPRRSAQRSTAPRPRVSRPSRVNAGVPTRSTAVPPRASSSARTAAAAAKRTAQSGTQKRPTTPTRPKSTATGPAPSSRSIDPFILFLRTHKDAIMQAFNNNRRVAQSIVEGSQPFSRFFADVLRSYNSQVELFARFTADAKTRATSALEGMKELVHNFIVRKLS